MGVSRWLFNDWFTAHELDQVDARLEHLQTAHDMRQLDVEDDVDGLRRDLARTTLLARALADVCLDKGLLTRDELRSRMFELDLSDGKQDGGLDPRHAPEAGA